MADERPFTDMIYSAAHKKNTQETKSVPTTPRKSSRIASKSETSEAEPTTYAEAAAEAPAKDNVVIPAQTPRRSGRSRVSTVQRSEGGNESPMRMTRSKSKSRGLGSDDE